MPDPPAPDRPGSDGFELRRSEGQELPPPDASRARWSPATALAAALVVLLALALLVWLLAT